jgi:hypothetical protein
MSQQMAFCPGRGLETLVATSTALHRPVEHSWGHLQVLLLAEDANDRVRRALEGRPATQHYSNGLLPCATVKNTLRVVANMAQ